MALKNVVLEGYGSYLVGFTRSSVVVVATGKVREGLEVADLCVWDAS